jgi:hypothetical protein
MCLKAKQRDWDNAFWQFKAMAAHSKEIENAAMLFDEEL